MRRAQGECLQGVIGYRCQSRAVRRRHLCFACHEEARPMTLAGTGFSSLFGIDEVSWLVAGVSRELASGIAIYSVLCDMMCYHNVRLCLSISTARDHARPG